MQLLENVAHAVSNNKIVRVYINDKGFLDKYADTDDIVFVKDCKNADIVITNNIEKLNKACIEKPIFVTTYQQYKGYKTVIGALFWQKGRPVLIFRRESITRLHIKLPNQLKKYLDY